MSQQCEKHRGLQSGQWQALQDTISSPLCLALEEVLSCWVVHLWKQSRARLVGIITQPDLTTLSELVPREWPGSSGGRCPWNCRRKRARCAIIPPSPPKPKDCVHFANIVGAKPVLAFSTREQSTAHAPRTSCLTVRTPCASGWAGIAARLSLRTGATAACPAQYMATSFFGMLGPASEPVPSSCLCASWCA